MSYAAALGQTADELKRLKKIVAQQKETLADQSRKYFKLQDKLRDANAYISVLEHETEMFQQQISDLEQGVNK